MKVLVTGASGFVGRHAAGALRAAGHQVVALEHRAAAGVDDVIAGDFTRDTDPAVWIPRLAGIDAVLNAVGILRESGARTFAALHVEAPRALFTACLQANVRKVVQISALGADGHARSRYHTSKAQADRHLAALPLDWVVLQPSLVFGTGGASATLFATLASLPVVPLPARGEQRVQPVHIDDLAAACVRVIETRAHDRQTIAVVGPEAMSVRGLLASMRLELGLGRPRFLIVPDRALRVIAALSGRIPGVPFDAETLGMLARGNEAPAGAITQVLGRPPRCALAFVRAGGSQAVPAAGAAPGPAADWARLNWLLPLARFAVALVWIVTGVLSLGVYPVADSYALLSRLGASGVIAAGLLYGGAILDLLLGLGVLVLRRRVWLWRAQIAVMLAYSAIIAVALPEYWLHPFGPMLKNLPLLVLIVALHEFERRG